MKTKSMLAAFASVLILSVWSLLAEDPPRHVTKAERKLLKTDLNILFEQYKKVRTQLVELEFQMGLRQTEGGTSPNRDNEMQARRVDFLQSQVQLLRDKITNMGEQVERMEVLKEKDKSNKRSAPKS